MSSSKGRVVARRAAAVFCLLAALCFAAPLWQLLMQRDARSIDITTMYAPPSLEHPLGTDEVGRDVFLRLTQGGAVSLLIALAATASTLMVGCAIGVFAGYYGGRTDRLLMALTDGVIALPLLPFLIVLAAVDTQRLGLPEGYWGDSIKLVLIITVFGWTTIARLVRSEVLSLRSREYVRASLAMGTSHLAVMARHILPNTRATLMTATALTIIKVIMLEAGLSFLGMGILPPNPTLGNMLMNAQYDMDKAPTLAIFPGLLLSALVLCLLLMSDYQRKRVA